MYCVSVPEVAIFVSIDDTRGASGKVVIGVLVTVRADKLTIFAVTCRQQFRFRFRLSI